MRELKRLLVTGGAGFIGSAFVRYLLQDEAFAGEIVTLDALTYAGHLGNLEAVRTNPRHHFVHGSICDRELVGKVCDEHRIDTIVNFAAETHVDRSIAGPAEFITTNLVGTSVLLDVVRQREGVHFHQVSTDEVYGSLGPEGLFTEQSPYDPRSPYSASKAGADHLVRAYVHTYGISATLSSCSNNYGPYQFPEKLIPLMIANALERKPLPVYGDGMNVRDWLYVDDHAEAIAVILRFGRSGETYNVGGNCELTNLSLLKRLLEEVGRQTNTEVQELEALITFVKDRPGHDRRYAIDSTKIQRDLGWSPRMEITQGLTRTVGWYLENGAWLESVRSGEYRRWIDTQYA